MADPLPRRTPCETLRDLQRQHPAPDLAAQRDAQTRAEAAERLRHPWRGHDKRSSR